jgi:hypothetical protein
MHRQSDGVARVAIPRASDLRSVVLKFQAFLRTLLHELCRHRDYERPGLTDSFRAEGIYQRESSRLQQRRLLAPDRLASVDA